MGDWPIDLLSVSCSWLFLQLRMWGLWQVGPWVPEFEFLYGYIFESYSYKIGQVVVCLYRCFILIMHDHFWKCMKCMYIRFLTYSEILETCNFESLVNHLGGERLRFICDGCVEGIVGNLQYRLWRPRADAWKCWSAMCVCEEISFDMLGWVYSRGHGHGTSPSNKFDVKTLAGE